MTNGLVLLRDAAKGHLRVGATGGKLSWHFRGAMVEQMEIFKGADPIQPLQETTMPL